MKTNAVFVVDTHGAPKPPVHPAKARRMMREGEAAIFRTQPFTLITKAPGATQAAPSLQLKIDPGPRTTGLALLERDRLIWAAELTHRGEAIRQGLEKRRIFRRARRQRRTRYRQPRFLNRTRKAGWLPPSVLHRVQSTLTWVRRVSALAPVARVSLERTRFDLALVKEPEYRGLLYERTELSGCELFEYLLSKFGFACAYCRKGQRPLEIDHVLPRSRGGLDVVTNLAIACTACNRRKGDKTAVEFGHPRVVKRAEEPFREAVPSSVTRARLHHEIIRLGFRVETASGGMTRYNRRHLKITERAAWLDAACVGKTSHQLRLLTEQPLFIRAIGHGNRRLWNLDKFGFPRNSARRAKRPHGISAGDQVRCTMTRGKYPGTWRGHVAGISLSGSCLVITKCGKRINPRASATVLIRRRDGYSFAHTRPTRKRGESTDESLLLKEMS